MIKKIVIGFIVGIGKIIPGVSGSLLAMTLGIYEPLLEAVTNFFSRPLAHLKLLFSFSLGLLVALIVFSRLILFFITNYYYGTMNFFLGLILITFLPFTKELTVNKKTGFIFFLTLSVFFLTSIFQLPTFTFKPSFSSFLYTFFLGLIDAFTSIIPGISGTAIFMLLGSYEFVLSLLANPFTVLFAFYGGGVVIGLITVCYLMHYLLKKYRKETNMFVFACMLSSIFILIKSLLPAFHILHLLFFGFGLLLGFFLNR